MLRSLICVRSSLVQLYTDLAEKYAKCYPNNKPAVCGQVRIRKICRRMYVSINGPGDLDLWNLKRACESHLRWGTFIPNFGTLGLCVLELFAMYGVRDVRTDKRADKNNADCPLHTGGGIKSER